MLSNCVEIRCTCQTLKNQDAGFISKKDVAERLPRKNFHAMATFMIRHTQMRHRSALDGAGLGLCTCYAITK